MTNVEAIDIIKHILEVAPKEPPTECDNVKEWFYEDDKIRKAHDMAIKALEQEPCEDAISRQSLKSKLKEHHDFFVNAYGGFSNLPRNDKSRVDEITNCIAMVVNEPSVNPQMPKTGHWIPVSERLPKPQKTYL